MAETESTPQNRQEAFQQSFAEAEEEVSGEDTEEPDEKDQPSDTNPSGEGDATEASEPASEESDSQPEPSEESEEPDTEEDEDEPGPIPYSRFNEVVEERNDYREELNDVRSELNDLQQDVTHFTQSEEGARRMVEHYQEQGFLESEDVPGTAEETEDESQEVAENQVKETLRQSFPEETAEAIIQMIEAGTQPAKQAKQEVEELKEEQELTQKEQQAYSRLQNQAQQMASVEDEYEYFEELGVETENVEVNGQQVEMTKMDQVAYQHPDMFLLDEVESDIIDPDKLDELYELTLARSGVLESRVEQAREEGAKQKEEELSEKLENNASSAPMSPASGSTQTDGENAEAPVESFQDAFDKSWRQHAGST